MSTFVPQRYSPQYTPAPLPIPTRRPSHRAHPSFSDSDDGSSEPASTHIMTQHPYQGTDEDPLLALCRAVNAAKTALTRVGLLTKTHELTVLQGSASPALPTHVLAITDMPLSDPDAPAILIPIDIEIFSRKVRSDLISTRSVPKLPRWPGPGRPTTLSLPVVPLQVPHAPSAPLLLLFALGIRNDPSALAASLLPLAAAEEFPSAAAMAQAMATSCDHERLGRYLVYNQGVWKNVLFFGVQDARVMSIVQTIWNVTSDGRKLWNREHERRKRYVNGS